MAKHGRCISKNEVFKVEKVSNGFNVSYKSGMFWAYWFKVYTFDIEAIEEKALEVINSALVLKVSSLDENGFGRYSLFLKA